ncbi:putative germin-like protein subfamily 1 member 2 [Hirschfeldia incana]|nr:putative germin-like protein subfamily 1 member 2 [Hirschfeldia incana]
MKSFLQFLIAKIILLALACSIVTCYDPSPLQDYCVATDDINGVFVNGRFCKDPKQVTSNDFYYSGLNIPGDTNNRLGSSVTDVDVRKIRGLNTLGVAIARFDFAPGVLKGTLLVGFVSSRDYNYTLFSKVLYPGDVFAFPIGLVQFHANIGKTNAVAIGAVGSQDPGVVPIGKTLFGSKPLIDTELLAKAFALDVNKVRYLQRVFSSEDYIVN